MLSLERVLLCYVVFSFIILIFKLLLRFLLILKVRNNNGYLSNHSEANSWVSDCSKCSAAAFFVYF